MDHEVEASTERVRHHLRRPLAGSRNLLMKTAGNTVPVTDPGADLAANMFQFVADDNGYGARRDVTLARACRRRR
jgi:hypothetical protein